MAKDKNKTTQLAGTGSMRRRLINRPEGKFAHFLDALISYDFSYFPHPHAAFTAYKKALASDLSIQDRQLSRLLSGRVLPESRLLQRLSKRFPHVQAEGWLPKLSWACIEREMELLPEGSVVTLFVGHLSAAQIDSIDEEVATNIARNIYVRRFKFVYCLAPLSALLREEELPPDLFVDRLRLRILTKWLLANPYAKRDATEKQIRDRLCTFQTKASDEVTHFWSLLPRYLAAANLLAEPKSAFYDNQFTASFESVSIPYPPNRANRERQVPVPITTGGWSYLPEDYDGQIRRMFAKLDEARLLVNPENKNQRFPRPQ